MTFGQCVVFHRSEFGTRSMGLCVGLSFTGSRGPSKLNENCWILPWIWFITYRVDSFYSRINQSSRLCAHWFANVINSASWPLQIWTLRCLLDLGTSKIDAFKMLLTDVSWGCTRPVQLVNIYYFVSVRNCTSINSCV